MPSSTRLITIIVSVEVYSHRFLLSILSLSRSVRFPFFLCQIIVPNIPPCSLFYVCITMIILSLVLRLSPSLFFLCMPYVVCVLFFPHPATPLLLNPSSFFSLFVISHICALAIDLVVFPFFLFYNELHLYNKFCQFVQQNVSEGESECVCV